MNRSSSILLFVIAIVLIVFASASVGYTYCLRKLKSNIDSDYKSSADTIVVYKHDTVGFAQIEYKDRVVVDTLYIIVKDTVTVPIPMSRYHFTKEGFFDIWAKGYKVSLEEVNIYPQEKTVTIHDVVVRENIDKGWSWYFGGGITVYNGQLIPNINLSVQPQTRWVYGANLGYYNSNLVFGININYKFR